MVANPDFIADVERRVPRDARVIVACQRGLRSLAACEQLSRAGFRALAWLNGGLDMALPGDLPTAPPDADPRYAGIGGASALLGWTEVQQERDAGFLGGAGTALRLLGVFLALDALLFAYEFYAAGGDAGGDAGGALGSLFGGLFGGR